MSRVKEALNPLLGALPEWPEELQNECESHVCVRQARTVRTSSATIAGAVAMSPGAATAVPTSAAALRIWPPAFQYTRW